MAIEFDFDSVQDFEDIGPRFAMLIRYAWQESAVNFATDLAIHGADPASLRLMAGRWRECDFDPPQFAAALELLADDVATLTRPLTQ